MLDTIIPSSYSLELQFNTKRTTPILLNYATGSLWKETLTYENLTDEERGQLLAYVAKIRNNTIQVPVFSQRLGTVGTGSIPSGLIANTADKVYNKVFCSAAALDNLYVGDYVRIADKLKVVTKKDSGISFEFEPPFATTQNATVFYKDALPWFYGQLTSNPSFVTSNFSSNITLEFEEI